MDADNQGNYCRLTVVPTMSSDYHPHLPAMQRRRWRGSEHGSRSMQSILQTSRPRLRRDHDRGGSQVFVKPWLDKESHGSGVKTSRIAVHNDGQSRALMGRAQRSPLCGIQFNGIRTLPLLFGNKGMRSTHDHGIMFSGACPSNDS